MPVINSPGMELIFKGDLNKFTKKFIHTIKYSRNSLQSEKLMFLIEHHVLKKIYRKIAFFWRQAMTLKFNASNHKQEA
jgi:hypothetical protein